VLFSTSTPFSASVEHPCRPHSMSADPLEQSPRSPRSRTRNRCVPGERLKRRGPAGRCCTSRGQGAKSTRLGGRGRGHGSRVRVQKSRVMRKAHAMITFRCPWVSSSILVLTLFSGCRSEGQTKSEPAEPVDLLCASLAEARCDWARGCCELSELLSLLGLEDQDAYSVEVARKAQADQSGAKTSFTRPV